MSTDYLVCHSYFDGKRKVLRKFPDARTATLPSDFGDTVASNEVRKGCYRSHDAEPVPTLDEFV